MPRKFIQSTKTLVMLYAFEKLDVWQKSRFLTKEIYSLTRTFPDEERYGLVSQLRRAVISVCSNIAEGSTRQSNKDKARFYELAYGSLIEILNQLIITADLSLIKEETLLSLRPSIEELTRMVNALSMATRRS
ncbi:MAG TPA: four helix bundle protein [Bacteroidales bacterium]|nr:four helix bundle protein [Bacteroidales bacterium]